MFVALSYICTNNNNEVHFLNLAAMTNSKAIKEFSNAISSDLHLTKEQLYTKYALMAGFCGLTMKLAIAFIIVAAPFFAAAQTTKKTPPTIPAPTPVQESECIKIKLKPLLLPYDTTEVVVRSARQTSLAPVNRRNAVKQ